MNTHTQNASTADTSSLLITLGYFDQFDTIYVPFGVIKELDRHKTRSDRVGSNARNAIRKIMNDSRFSVCDEIKDIAVDDEVIKVGEETSSKIVTADYALYLKAIGKRLDASIANEYSILERPVYFESFSEEVVAANGSYGIVRNGSDRLARIEDGQLRYISKHNLNPGFGKVTPANMEQIFFVDSMLSESIKLVIATGTPGSGKTFIALAAAMHLVEKGFYDRIIIMAPPVETGNRHAYGYVPGSICEKSMTYMMGLMDNIKSLRPDMAISTADSVNELIPYIEIQPFTLVRGRNFDKCIVIVDEAQNATRDDVKAILTRVTDRSKVVILGDIEQSDISSRTGNDTGIYEAIKAFYGDAIAANIKLKKSKRGILCTKAYELL